MTNKQWVKLIAKEFNISNFQAKNMLFAMYKTYNIFKVNNKNIKKDKEKG